ncbi:MAG: hypothetical protein PHC61_03635 [Chitinivibrionales bacterium]|nr:hypothetical protein [Chitinivibrionales bacterium]
MHSPTDRATKALSRSLIPKSRSAANSTTHDMVAGKECAFRLYRDYKKVTTTDARNLITNKFLTTTQVESPHHFYF